MRIDKRLSRREFLRKSALVGAGATGLAIAGCTTTIAPSGHLKQRHNYIKGTMDYRTEHAGYTCNVLKGNLIEPLVSLRPDWVYEGVLAESIETTDNKDWTLNIRSGVKYHDGTALTAEIVADWLNIFCGNETVENITPRYSSHLAKYRTGNGGSIEATDTLTVEMHSETTDWGLMYSFIDDSSLLIAHPDNYTDTEVLMDLVGTGPYKDATFSPNDQIHTDRYDDYWGNDVASGHYVGPNLFDEVTVYYMADETTTLVALQNNEINISNFETWGTISQIMQDPDLKYLSGYQQVKFIGLNLNQRVGNPLIEKDLRKVLCIGVDWDTIIPQIVPQYAIAHDHFVNTAAEDPDRWYDYMSYDPDTAQTIVDQLLDDGKSVDLRCLQDITRQHYGDLAVAMKAALDPMGCNIELVPTVSQNFGSIYRNNLTGPERWDVAYHSSIAIPGVGALAFQDTIFGADSNYGTDGAGRFGITDDPVLDQLIADTMASDTQADLDANLILLAENLYSNYRFCPYFMTNIFLGMRLNVMGYDAVGVNSNDRYHFNHAYIE